MVMREMIRKKLKGEINLTRFDPDIADTL